jgi:hypothetical protein
VIYKWREESIPTYLNFGLRKISGKEPLRKSETVYICQVKIQVRKALYYLSPESWRTSCWLTKLLVTEMRDEEALHLRPSHNPQCKVMWPNDTIFPFPPIPARHTRNLSTKSQWPAAQSQATARIITEVS